ncbi:MULTISPECIES: hypothetical protein [Halomonadaceae]|uniref:hypothetical protein n=1 Tax=Halomonadaceae TaxID=28256 RepID=UPI001582A39E|nr:MULTISPECIES: hypothetical protein [Halomonas]MDI4636702.1 hypothetical protein [Halomonas sp. BMC7]NUJ61067.1 hypothetical protein [Halomonas taeanensis]
MKILKKVFLVENKERGWGMKYKYEVSENDYPFDEEWDFEWEAGNGVTSASETGEWWGDKELESGDDSEGIIEADKNDALYETLPCEMEEVLEGDNKFFVEHLRRVEALVKGVARKRESHFEVIEGKGRLKICQSLHGKEFRNLLKRGCDPRCHQLSVVDQNPFVGVYHKVVKKWESELREVVRYGVMQGGVPQTVETLNRVVDDLRRELDRPIIKSFAKRVDRSAQERGKKAVAIIDKCFQHRSRLLVLRVDLGYRKGLFIESPDFSRDLATVKQHWAALSTGLKKGKVVPNVMEVFGKLEYGVLSGFHFHLVVIMKGAEHQEDINYAKKVGQYWCKGVVGEEGRYFNCNRIKHRYKRLGIGEINYYEDEKVSALKEVVVSYVVKSDYYMSALSPSKKTFVQLSCTNKDQMVRRGRPRRYLSKV